MYSLNLVGSLRVRVGRWYVFSSWGDVLLFAVVRSLRLLSYEKNGIVTLHY